MKRRTSCFRLLVVLVCTAPSIHAFSLQAPSVVQNDQIGLTSQDFTAFWGKERSNDEIKTYIETCLGRGAPMTFPHQHQQPRRVEVLSAEPPLVVIHDMLSLSMCEEIIQAAEESNALERSTTGSAQETSDTRTSSTVWLREGQCQHPLQFLSQQVSSVCGLPSSHMENLQVVRYLPGQEFKLHTDHRDSFNELECRGRLATCLLYLDEPEQGGATWFPGILPDEEELIIGPKRGSAVFFWNSVERPGSKGYTPETFLNTDLRLRHAGLPVERGEKWVCNLWIHPIPFPGKEAREEVTAAATKAPRRYASL